MNTLGLDIGGANIKAASSSGRTLSRPFAMWKHPEHLESHVASICREFPEAQQLAIVMTAELADCFTTKAEGVRFILDQIESGARSLPYSAWTTEGQFVAGDAAREQPMLVAAANWHALATWVGKTLIKVTEAPPVPESSAILIDIGTTTTDIIPLVNGCPASSGNTDLTRLQSGELCYSGVKRTPLCALAHSVPFHDGYCALAAELFATTLDLYLLLGTIPENDADLETANGRPATRAAAHDRLARMLCADRQEVTFDDAVQIAKFLADVQRQRLAGALDRVVHRLPAECQTVVVSGSGAFLARQIAASNRRTSTARMISLDDMLSPGIAESACAYAAAQLATMTSEVT